MSNTRRVFFYLVTAAALGVLASGLNQLLTLLFDTVFGSSIDRITDSFYDFAMLSFGIAMVVVAGPLWFFFWRSIQSRTVNNIGETGSRIRKLYLNGLLVIAGINLLTSLSMFLSWLVSGFGGDFRSESLASAIVSGLIWYYHWRVSEREGSSSAGAQTLRRWYVYILSGVGLCWLVSGFVMFINSCVQAIPVWGDVIASSHFWRDGGANGIIMMIIGGAAWYFHWYRMARGDYDSVLRQVYFYLLAITGGAAAAVTAIIVLLQTLITWALGGVSGGLGQHFLSLGWAIPLALAGGWVWIYHHKVAEEEAERLTEIRKSSAERAHLYIMSFIGLGVLSAGVIMVLGILLNFAIGEIGTPILIGTGWWQSQAGLAIALIGTGLFLWNYFWRRVLLRTKDGGIEEWRAASRRFYLYAVAVITIGALIASLVNIIYQIIRGVTEGSSGDTLSEIRWSIQTLLVAAPLLWYHWGMVRQDMKRGAEVQTVKHQVTLLTSDTTGRLSGQLETKLGYGIKVNIYAAGGVEIIVAEDELDRAAGEVENAPTARVMVINEGNSLRVIPYVEK